MTTDSRCPRCGRALTAGAPHGLCPTCLLEAGLAEQTNAEGGDADTSLGGPHDAPPPSHGPSGDAARAPAHVGPYTVLGVLGEGGMGIVYLAEQTAPIHRRVALKLVKPGMDSREVLRRFDAERQALALMDHPHIARVLDAGLGPGGRPYFVMEYVPGLTITDYCDRHRLTNTERLQLFLPICAALQHAHQKGVIHRDLKPSNILVAVQDGKPVPKVIDFGIAKATHRSLADRAAFTELGMLIGTPEYMSPEQAEASGLEVDTTTDIYSLGVVLYELLVGALPFDPVALRQAGYAEIQRIIRDEDPPTPSTRASTLGATAEDVAKRRQTTPPALSRQVRGDLDAITMKALEKDRTRRYASASELAADLERYLRGDAVLARPASVAYRTKKFVRRHKVGVAAGTLVALSLAAGLGISTVLYFQVRTEREASDYQSYLANIAAADAHVRADEGTDARRRLLAAPASLRGWEWHHLWATSLPVEASLPGPAGDSGGELFAISGGSIFTRGEQGFDEWDRSTFQRITSRPLPGEALAVDAKARRVIVAIGSQQARSYAVVDLATGEVLSRPALSDDFPHFAPDGSHFVTEDRAAVTWWDAESGIAAGKRITTSSTRVLGFTPDSRAVLLKTSSEIRLWTPASGQETVAVQFEQGMRIDKALMTTDGTRILTASGDGGVFEWDVRTHAQIREFGKRVKSYDIAMSADGTLVALGYLDTIGVWDRTTGMKIADLREGNSLTMSGAMFSPDGRQVAATSRYGDVRVWDIRRARLAAGLELPEKGVVAAGGRYALVSHPSGGFARLDLETLMPERVAETAQLTVSVMAISPDGMRLAASTADGAVLVWPDPTSVPFVLDRGEGGWSGLTLSFSRDAARLAGVYRRSGAPNKLRVWDLASRQRLLDVDTDLREAEFDSSGKRVLVVGPQMMALERRRHEGMAKLNGPTCNSDTADTLQVWDLESGGKVMGIRQECFYASAFVGEAGVVSDSWRTPLLLHSLRTGSVVQRSEEMPTTISLAVSPDGSRIAVGTGESQVLILDARTLETLLAIRVSSQISRAFFSADGARLITTARSGRSVVVRVYDTQAPHEPGRNGPPVGQVRPR